MGRRESILALVALGLGAGARGALSQPKTGGVPARVAILDDAPEAVRARLWTMFRKRLNELGHTEGKDLLIEARWARGDLERLPGLAGELVALKPDVIVAVTTTVALATKKATSLIPIVALGPADPVKSGLVASLARPGGNLTGVSPNQAEIAGKWVEMVREIVPGAKSVAYLTDPGNPGEMLVFGEVQQRARPLGIRAHALDGVTLGSVEQAFATIKREPIDAIIVATTTSLLAHRQQIVEAAARLRIPAIYARREYLEAGGLLSYGTNLEAVFSRGAEYVHRILQGTQPAELPFEMASTFTLVVNLTTARALGAKIPQSVLARADQVIE
jgi:putative ABC transport system substrate-binding protein